jgi:hypothetical protein
MVSRIDNITVIPDIQKTGTTLRLEESRVDYLVTTYLEELNKNRKTPEGSDLREFFSCVKRAVESRQATEGIPRDKYILFVEDDPPEALDTEAITFYVDSRMPGRFDQGPSGVGKIKEVTPHLRAVREHPENPSEKLITMGRFYDNWINFVVYARNAKTAFDRVLWFERLMDAYGWYFRLNGFRVVEEGIGERLKIKLDELTIVSYKMSFMVRTDDTFHFSTQELKHVVLNVNVSNSYE